jgi:hypothetical protein
MNIIPPITITDAMLTSSTAVETPPAAYNPATTYALDDTVSVAGSAGLMTVYKSLANANMGNTPDSSPDWWSSLGDTYQVYSGVATYAQGERVVDTTNHLVYESVINSNTGNALTDDTKWLEIGPTNRWAMFDILRNTQTVQPSSITVVIAPGERIDSIALLGMVGNTATVTVTVDGDTVYTRTEDLNTRFVSNWYEYFFRKFSTRPSMALFNLPPYTEAVITITVSATSGDAAIGACVLGAYEFIGDVQYEAESDVLNFSTVTRNFDGTINTAQMVQRRNVPKTIQQIFVDKARVNRVRQLRDALNGLPAVWAGLDNTQDDYFEALLILGFYRRFSINLQNPKYAVISLELEEI